MIYQKPTKTITGAYTTTDADIGHRIICNSETPFTITLHTATGRYNFDLEIDNIGTGAVTVGGRTVGQYQHAHIGNDGGAAWTVVIGGGGSSSGGADTATATLTVAGWSSSSQTATATGVTASNIAIVAPSPSSQDDYVTAGIKCTAQGTDTLTFTCTTTPTAELTVNVVILAV